MAKRRSSTPETSQVDQSLEVAATSEVAEASEATETTTEAEVTHEAPEATEVAETTEATAEVEVAHETSEEKQEELTTETPKKDTSPAKVELKTGGQDDPALGQITKEQIEATIQDKLSRRSDSEESNPFVPSTQLENEVKQIAEKKGFPLSRGTEIGARLLARSSRIKK